MPNTGGFEVQNSRGHEGGKYLGLFVCRRKSSIVGNGFDAIPIPQLSQHCTGWYSAALKVLPLVGAKPKPDWNYQCQLLVYE